MDDPLQSLVDAHLLIGLDRHTWIDELLAGRERTLDPNGKVLHVEPDHQVPVHRLARLGRADGRWTWAWANGGLEDPSRSVSQSLAELALEELGRPAFSPPIDPEILALVCAALADAQTWTRIEGDGADEILLVDGPPEDPLRSPPLSLQAMNLVDRELSAGRGLIINRAAVLAYLEALGLPASVTDEEIDLQDGSDVRFEFDRHGRVAWTGTIPVTRSTAPYPQVGEPQGSPLMAFNPPDLERSPGWRDADGVSPIGLLRRYLTERHAWEIAANDTPPED